MNFNHVLAYVREDHNNDTLSTSSYLTLHFCPPGPTQSSKEKNSSNKTDTFFTCTYCGDSDTESNVGTILLATLNGDIYQQHYKEDQPCCCNHEKQESSSSNVKSCACNNGKSYAHLSVNRTWITHQCY